MKLPEVECVFDTSRSIYCLKPKGSHVGLSGDEIEEVARRCNNHEKFKTALEKIADDNSYEPCTPIAKQALKEVQEKPQ